MSEVKDKEAVGEHSGHRRSIGVHGQEHSDAEAAEEMTKQLTENPTRMKIHRFVSSSSFELCMSVVILLNVALMIAETDQNAQCVTDGRDVSECETPEILVANCAFLVIYVLESLARLYAERSMFFRSIWNGLDTGILICGWLDFIVTRTVGSFPGPSATVLRIFRVARLVRILRLISIFPELYELVRGFIAAMMAMFWGFVLIIVFVTIFSIVSVEVLNPINVALTHENDYCRDAFNSVWNCMLMLIQTLVAGDSWGQCAIPIIQRSKLASVIFVFALTCIQLGATNLILAVIVERADKAHINDVEQQIKEKTKEKELAAAKLREDLHIIDANGSGAISASELIAGYENNPSLHRQLQALDISKRDLHAMFDLVNESNSGELDYDILVDTILQASMGDFRKHILMMSLQSGEMARILKNNRREIQAIRGSVSMVTTNPSMESHSCRTLPDSIRKTRSEVPPQAASRNGNFDNLQKDGSPAPSGDIMLKAILTPQPKTQDPAISDPPVSDGAIIKKLDDLEREIVQTISSWASSDLAHPLMDQHQDLEHVVIQTISSWATNFFMGLPKSDQQSAALTQTAGEQFYNI